MVEKKQYIEANKMIQNLTAMKKYFDSISLDGMIKGIQREICEDVIEVVRCKDCKYFCFSDTQNWCSQSNNPGRMYPNDFCSYGEKKEVY